MTIKSLQVIRRFVFEEWGGTETVVWNTSLSLAKSGNPVEILSTSALDRTPAEEQEGIAIRRFPYFYPYLNLNKQKISILDKKGGDPYSLPLYKYMIEKGNVDLIHCHTMNRIAASVRLAARKKKIPYLVSFHGGHFAVPKEEMALMTAPYKGTFNYGRIIDLLIKKQRYLQDADAIICVGYNEYKLTRERYPQKLVYYLPNGVDHKKFSAAQSSNFRARFGIPENSRLILCLSRIDYQKNQKLLIALLDRIRDKDPNSHLLLVGPVTSENYYLQIEKLIKAKKLKKKVTIIKGLKADDPDLVRAYKSASMFILPSIHEPFGIVALEAWASGLPVIAAKVGGLERLITDRKTGLLFNGRLDDLEQKYLELISNNSLREQLVTNAEKSAREEYSWQAITERLLEYYEEILQQYRKKK